LEENMSKQTREFFEQLKGGEQPTLLESIKEGVQAIAPGLSLSKILGDVGAEMKEQAAHGAHEMAAALFRGDAFVMYPRTNQAEGPDHGLPQEMQQQEQSRGGREV
jgi:hypothetical protein